MEIFPNAGYYPITENPAKTVSYMMLPWLVLGADQLTDYARFTRGQMVETLNEDYIRTAQAKGMRRAEGALQARPARRDRAGDHDLRPRLRHPARRARSSSSRSSASTGSGTGGCRPSRRPIDINVVSTTVLVGAILIVVANLLVDIAYGFLDPRVTVA